MRVHSTLYNFFHSHQLDQHMIALKDEALTFDCLAAAYGNAEIASILQEQRDTKMVPAAMTSQQASDMPTSIQLA